MIQQCALIETKEKDKKKKQWANWPVQDWYDMSHVVHFPTPLARPPWAISIKMLEAVISAKSVQQFRSKSQTDRQTNKRHDGAQLPRGRATTGKIQYNTIYWKIERQKV